jgi:hypothetical protein
LDASLRALRLVVSSPASELIAEQGGRLFVWVTRNRSCVGGTRLETATSPPAGKKFRRLESSADFELYLPLTLTRLPDELHVEVRRFPRRVESYWDGCVCVT